MQAENRTFEDCCASLPQISSKTCAASDTQVQYAEAISSRKVI